MMGYIQMLQYLAKQKDDQRLTDVLDKSQAQVKKMNTMINGFLDMSRFEAGRINLDRQLFSLDELILEMIADTQLITSTHQFVVETSAPISIRADRDKIGQVVTNLLSNATKYSPKGTQVLISCHSGSAEVVVSIADQGLGVSVQDIEKIFERFYRVENKQTATISGFGIGLYLCAEIIQRHQGKIWVESDGFKGSAFHFKLPLGF